MKKILIIATILMLFSNCTKKNEVNLKIQFSATYDYTWSIDGSPDANSKDLTNGAKTIVWDLNKKIKVHIKNVTAKESTLWIYFHYQNKTYIVTNIDVATNKPVGDVVDFNGKLY
tara:strand:+ start:5628 stop:5972 length:345 start_codon:yes stop_codon:yes gene_type:complete